MSTNAHTPGPFEYDSHLGEVQDGMGGTIAYVPHEAHADGRLFAAAPDLLGAAQALAEAVDAGDDFAEADAMRALGLAIAKATEAAS